MGRPARAQPAGETFHLTARGVRRTTVFHDDLDYWLYLRLLGQTAERFQWLVLGYCLMPTHVHLLVRLREPSLSAGMHRQQGLYARRFNERNGFTGHVFEARFHSVLIEREEHLLRAIRYLAWNPVQAHLCLDPGEWPWSSHATVAGRGHRWSPVDARPIRAMFGRDRSWLRRYLAFIEGSPAFEPWPS